MRQPLRAMFNHKLATRAGLVSTLFLTQVCVLLAQTAVTTYHNDNYRTGMNSTKRSRSWSPT